MSDERRRIELPDIEIDADVLKQFEELDAAVKTNPWTAEKDKLLLMFWPVKNHQKVADLLGLSPNTCLKRYRHLTQ